MRRHTRIVFFNPFERFEAFLCIVQLHIGLHHRFASERSARSAAAALEMTLYDFDALGAVIIGVEREGSDNDDCGNVSESGTSSDSSSYDDLPPPPIVALTMAAPRNSAARTVQLRTTPVRNLSYVQLVNCDG